MEQPSSSSKVTVEYFDPDGVYPLLVPGLLPRLPLRNLHWESHAGPLRSISALHIDLIPSTIQLSPLSTVDLAFANAPSLSRVKSEDSATVSDDGFRTQALGQTPVERPDSRSGVPKSAVKERRHQIPGLRQTPYLKVFFLRCDDNDTYKNQARRQVREWIKEHTPSTQSTSKLNAQENHDAFEWLIVHVVVPNTAAATQPRASGKSTDGSTGSATEKATRWRGSGSSTLLEKLRADFNSSSKSAVDRVAQIRIGVNDVPYDMLPRVVPAIPGSYTETTQESEVAWVDLVSKFKSLILSSFDMRVTQYEEDIREKDAQRSLPGWNFCTFFMLKEGLARGFESVGLVEDSLVGYDELAVGLDTIIREQFSVDSGAQHGGSFLPYTEDLKLLVNRAKSTALKNLGSKTDVQNADESINLQSANKSSDNEPEDIPLTAMKKRYRELILANNISIFDFRCYLFARQLSLLLRLANAWSSREELLAKLKEQRESTLQGVAARVPASPRTDDVENLSVLGEVCRRSMDFVSSISHIMRDDILASQKPPYSADGRSNADPQANLVLAEIIENVVSSFTFSVTQQVLAQTSTKSLPIPPSTLAPPSSKIGVDGQEPKAAIPEPKTMMHPARSSSLALRSRSREPPSPGLFPGGRRSSVPDRGDRSSVSSGFLKPGLEELAAHRAELYLLSRNILEKVGKERGWSVGWAEVSSSQYSDAAGMEDVALDEKPSDGTRTPTKISEASPSLYGIDSKLLRVALENRDDYYRLYETLTDKALRHYTVASHTQSVKTSMADLAVLKYHLADYAAAASYFYQMTDFYGENGWTRIELSMLVLWAKSLKRLDRKEEYVRVVLKLLSKAAMVENERISRASSIRLGRARTFSVEKFTPSETYLEELLHISKSLQHEVQIPLQSFFGRVEVEGAPRYHSGQDSFALQFRLRYLLSEDIQIDKVKVKITPIDGDNNREIWLESENSLLGQKGNINVSVRSNVIIPGMYIVSHVALHTGNAVLKYEHANTAPAFSREEPFFKGPKLLIYQQAESLDVKLFASRYMHLDRNRSLEIELSSGWNDVRSGELHVRPATAGLRLQTSEAEVVSGKLELSKKAEVGVVRFGAINPNTFAKIRMPFNLEHEVNDISLRLEISYTTDKGEFLFATTPHMSIMLPLGVNVQDTFKDKALFSRFTISSSTTSPLRLLSSKLENSDIFTAECGIALTKPIVVFPRQPASLLYKIIKSDLQSKYSQFTSRKVKKSSLSLVLHYICLEEEIDNAVTVALHRALADTPLQFYIRLVVASVLAEVHERISRYDLERTAILSEISTAILSDVAWKNHFFGLGRRPEDGQDISTLLAEKLQRWQRHNPNIPLIPLSLDENTINNSRSIIIPVEVPSVTAVHTADLKLTKGSSIPANLKIVASHEPISASLDIKSTTKWDTDLHSDLDASNQPDHFEFVYEVSGSPDTWLIGGRRKGHFKIPRSRQAHTPRPKFSFPVVLIPLREGFLPYPNVEIKPAPVTRVIRSGASSAGDSGSPIKQSAITCETDYRNWTETVRSISDARKTTVSLDASGPQGGAWLLESERRADKNDGGILF